MVSDGNVILGYIPKERLRSGRWNQTLERRYGLWDAATGSTIATFMRFLPRADSPGKSRDGVVRRCIHLLVD